MGGGVERLTGEVEKLEENEDEGSDRREGGGGGGGGGGGHLDPLLAC